MGCFSISTILSEITLYQGFAVPGKAVTKVPNVMPQTGKPANTASELLFR